MSDNASPQSILSETSAQTPDLSALSDTIAKLAPSLLSALGENTDLASMVTSLFASSDSSSSPTESSSPTLSLSANPSITRKTQLLKALKPYLKPERADKIDRAISMLQTAYSAKSALSLISVAAKDSSETNA